MTAGKLNGLDLFSGYGGISLALSEWVRPIAYCEIERYAQGILLSRMSEGSLPAAPIWDNVSTLDGRSFRGDIDIIYGGFPCQDISVAGAGKGLAGKRSGLFREILRLVDEISPPFIFLENVPAIRTRGLPEVVKELSDRGYDCRWKTISASEVGAPHKRERWFIVGIAKSERIGRRLRLVPQENEGESGPEIEVQDPAINPINTGQGATVLADAQSLGRREGRAESKRVQGRPEPSSGRLPIPAHDWWQFEPDVGRVVNGCAFRVDRIKALGNGVVPAQVRQAFKDLMGLA